MVNNSASGSKEKERQEYSGITVAQKKIPGSLKLIPQLNCTSYFLEDLFSDNSLSSTFGTYPGR